MSSATPQLAQDLRLLDLLQAHPELTEPEGLKLRERLTSLCETQGEPATPVRVAQTVVDYLSTAPAPSIPEKRGTSVPWNRPASHEEWEAAVNTILAGVEAKDKLIIKELFTALGVVVGICGIGLSLPSMTGLNGLLIILMLSAMGILGYFVTLKRLFPILRQTVKRKDETVKAWALRPMSGGMKVSRPEWMSTDEGVELNKYSVTLVGMRRYMQSARALAAFRALQDHPVPLLNLDIAHIESLLKEDEEAQQQVKNAHTLQEWKALLAAPAPTVLPNEATDG